MAQTRKISDLYTAVAGSFKDTMFTSNGNAGFKVPEYQREYNWDHTKIKRVLEDCGNGFHALTLPFKPTSFTFLGTVILVKDSEKEAEFDGESLCVVDGQQRLTTLILICSCLIQSIFQNREALRNIKSVNVKTWIQEEAKLQASLLYQCIAGNISDGIDNFPYPRIIRHTDIRAKNVASFSYESLISRYLNDFIEYYKKHLNEPFEKFDFSFDNENAKERRFSDNILYIQKQLAILTDIDSKERQNSSNIDVDIVLPSNFERTEFKDLFKKLSVLKDEKDRNKALSIVKNGGTGETLIRNLLFASYLMNYVVFTVVKTEDDGAAFEIFDSLNTTGEPLTAIETFKPLVMNFENITGNGYNGSISKNSFGDIAKFIDKVYSTTTEKQNQTKDLLVSFALLLDAEKLPKELSVQRLYLRSRYEQPEKKFSRTTGKKKLISAKQEIVCSLASLAEYRHFYWKRENINELNTNNLRVDLKSLDEAKLCLRFLTDMNKSLTIPILTRFWMEHNKINDNTFVEALKALTAFTVLRRATTGGTGNIDSDYRIIMSKGYDGNDPLCRGVLGENKLLDIPSFKAMLRSLLSRNAKFKHKNEWLKLVEETSLINQSKKLTRFMLLAAAHNSVADKNTPGLWRRNGQRDDTSKHFFNFATWAESPLYATVEHIAPHTRPETGWDDDIYKRPNTRQKLGNATLLPKLENSIIGNKDWEYKKRLYRALLSSNQEELNAIVEELQKAGKSLKKTTIQKLKDGSKLHLLEPLSKVTEWNDALIIKRTTNIADLAWDTISPWLY